MYKLKHNGKNNYNKTFDMLLSRTKKGINYNMLPLFFIISIFLIIMCIFLCLEVRVSISDFQISSFNKENTFEYKCKIGVYFLNKIKLFSLQLDKNKAKKIMEKKFFKEKIKKSKKMPKDKKKLQNKIIKHIIKKVQIKTLNLKLYIDTESAILTSYIVGIISTIIPNIICNNIKNFNNKDYKFEVLPVYKNQNYLYVKLNCIISIKVVHIMHSGRQNNCYMWFK